MFCLKCSTISISKSAVAEHKKQPAWTMIGCQPCQPKKNIDGAAGSLLSEYWRRGVGWLAGWKAVAQLELGLV